MRQVHADFVSIFILLFYISWIEETVFWANSTYMWSSIELIKQGVLNIRIYECKLCRKLRGRD